MVHIFTCRKRSETCYQIWSDQKLSRKKFNFWNSRTWFNDKNGHHIKMEIFDNCATCRVTLSLQKLWSYPIIFFSQIIAAFIWWRNFSLNEIIALVRFKVKLYFLHFEIEINLQRKIQRPNLIKYKFQNIKIQISMSNNSTR